MIIDKNITHATNKNMELNKTFKKKTGPKIGRRTFIKYLGLSFALVLRPGFASGLVGTYNPADKPAKAPRRLSFINLHTNERLTETYHEWGCYQEEALARINKILRDHRTGDIQSIDVRLLDFLFSINQETGTTHEFHVISGYRSPATNAMLYRTTKGVDKNSYHIKGRAIDIRTPKIRTDLLKKICLSLKGGGVGYYPKSNYIHVDTGPVRSWRHG